MFETSTDSSDKYRLANPLTDKQLQEEIIYRMIGWEISGNLPSYELVKIGKNAVESLRVD